MRHLLLLLCVSCTAAVDVDVPTPEQEEPVRLKASPWRALSAAPQVVLEGETVVLTAEPVDGTPVTWTQVLPMAPQGRFDGAHWVAPKVNADTPFLLRASGAAFSGDVQVVVSAVCSTGDHPYFTTRYSAERTHSPLSPNVVFRLQAIASRGVGLNPNVFAKVGDSITENTWAYHFMTCFAGPHVELGDHADLQATLTRFTSDADADPMARDSIAAQGGWNARNVLKGSPTRVERELAALQPQFAVVMLGTNDLDTPDYSVFEYARNMVAIIDTFIDKGVIPIMSTVPPKEQKPELQLPKVALYNRVIRAIAQGRQIPLVDLNRELLALPKHGLVNDHVHLNYFQREGKVRACVLTPEGLQYGYNTRNLLTLQALERASRGAVVDAPGDDRDTVPFSHMGAAGTHAFTVERAMIVHVMTLLGGRNVRLFKGEQELTHAERELSEALEPGDYSVAVEGDGETLVVVTEKNG